MRIGPLLSYRQKRYFYYRGHSLACCSDERWAPGGRKRRERKVEGFLQEVAFWPLTDKIWLREWYLKYLTSKPDQSECGGASAPAPRGPLLGHMFPPWLQDGGRCGGPWEDPLPPAAAAFHSSWMSVWWAGDGKCWSPPWAPWGAYSRSLPARVTSASSLAEAPDVLGTARAASRSDIWGSGSSCFSRRALFLVFSPSPSSLARSWCKLAPHLIRNPGFFLCGGRGLGIQNHWQMSAGRGLRTCQTAGFLSHSPGLWGAPVCETCVVCPAVSPFPEDRLSHLRVTNQAAGFPEMGGERWHVGQYPGHPRAALPKTSWGWGAETDSSSWCGQRSVSIFMIWELLAWNGALNFIILISVNITLTSNICSLKIHIHLTMQETQVWSLGWEDPLEEGNLLQCPCLENPMDRGTWWATVHGVRKSRTQLNH